jgi:hypothetical protein
MPIADCRPPIAELKASELKASDFQAFRILALQKLNRT